MGVCRSPLVSVVTGARVAHRPLLFCPLYPRSASWHKPELQPPKPAYFFNTNPQPVILFVHTTEFRRRREPGVAHP
jgi:hypothetical protein